MKRLALTLLAIVTVPACDGEVLNPSSEGGTSGDNDNVRVSPGDGGAEPSGGSTAGHQGTGIDSPVPALTGTGDARSTTSAEGSAFGNTNSGAASTLGTDTNSVGVTTGDTNGTDQTTTNDGTSAGDTVLADTATDESSTDTSGGDVSNTDTPSSGEQSSEHDASSDKTSDSSTSEPLTPAFDIDLVYLDEAEASTAVVESFERAEAFWEELIVGDLPDITTRRQACNGPDIYVEGTIDDLQIFVAVGKMDGPDGILGAAGPCLGRPTFDGGLPLAGFMQFDSEDLERYAQQGRLDEVIIHEMGHVLGFGGVLWQEQGYLADASDENVARDTHFTGEKAIAAFDAIGGNAYADAKVPVENIGGQGTANGHWREQVMGNEMMTSYMTNLEAVLSTVTLAALEDMGYEVDYSKAGGYEWPPPDERSSLFSLRTEAELPPIYFGNDILDIPYSTVE